MDNTREIALEAMNAVLDNSGKAISHARELAGKIRNTDHREALLKVSDLFEKSFEPFRKSIHDRLELLQGWDSKLKEVSASNATTALANNHKLSTLKLRFVEYRKALSDLRSKKKPINSLKKGKPGPSKSKPTSLLSPQELRDQIARKIQRPPAPPQTTGNIWENWSKNPQQTPPPADEENQP
jgi:hypothetical protein